MYTVKEMIELLKTEALSDKEKVITIQDKLLQCKDEQLTSLKSTVKAAVETTVQSTVQKEIKSYSGQCCSKPEELWPSFNTGLSTESGNKGDRRRQE